MAIVDLSCHVIDGTGCGPKSFADSVEMCRLAAASEVRTIIATVRWRAGQTEPPLQFDEFARKIESLCAETRSSLSIKSGFLLEFSETLPALVEKYGHRITLGAKHHLLISLPSTRLPHGAERVWGELHQMGFSVVLANPECSPALRRDAGRLDRWVAQGVKLQFDAASLVGAYGREVQKYIIENLIRFEGNAIIASNARSAITYLLGKARLEVARQIGDRRAMSFFRETPMAIIGEGDTRPNSSRDTASRRTNPLLRTLNSVKSLR